MSTEFRSMEKEAHELVESDLEVGPGATTALNEWLASWTNATLACDEKEATEARYHVQCLKWAIARKAHYLLLNDQPIRVSVSGGSRKRNATIIVAPAPATRPKKLHSKVSFPHFFAAPIPQPTSLPQVLPTFDSSCETDVKAELDKWLQRCIGKQFPTRSKSHDLARSDIEYAKGIVAFRGYGFFSHDKHVSLLTGGDTSYLNSEITIYEFGNNGRSGVCSFPSLKAELLPPPDPPE